MARGSYVNNFYIITIQAIATVITSEIPHYATNKMAAHLMHTHLGVGAAPPPTSTTIFNAIYPIIGTLYGVIIRHIDRGKLEDINIEANEAHPCLRGGAIGGYVKYGIMGNNPIVGAANTMAYEHQRQNLFDHTKNNDFWKTAAIYMSIEGIEGFVLGCLNSDKAIADSSIFILEKTMMGLIAGGSRAVSSFHINANYGKSVELWVQKKAEPVLELAEDYISNITEYCANLLDQAYCAEEEC